jgi:hypothetical protein
VPYQRIDAAFASITDERHGPAFLCETERVVLHPRRPADVAGDDDEGVAVSCGGFCEGVLVRGHGFAAAMRCLEMALWEQVSAKRHASSARGAAMEYVADASKASSCANVGARRATP